MFDRLSLFALADSSGALPKAKTPQCFPYNCILSYLPRNRQNSYQEKIPIITSPIKVRNVYAGIAIIHLNNAVSVCLWTDTSVYQ